MVITIQIPHPITLDRIEKARKAVEHCTSRPFGALIVEPPDYDPDRVDVRGTVKGVGPKTWQKWTVAVKTALQKVPNS